MTKKDYVLIASILHVAIQHMTYSQAAGAVEHACTLLKRDNPRFNEGKFREEVALPLNNMRRVLRDQ